MDKSDDVIFQNGSKTYYAATKLFPPEARTDVTKLYSFVRVADDFVDATPQDIEGFERLESLWRQLLADPDTVYGILSPDKKTDRVVRNMYDIAGKYNFDMAWIDAFLHSMKMDTYKRQYDTIEELNEYIYGSAEVIGLMMCRILGIDDELAPAARSQGAAMQLINFIRDLKEDQSLGRQYLPALEASKCGLTGLTQQAATERPEAYHRFITMQLSRYREWQANADEGIHAIPKRYRTALHVANDGYGWTARQIEKDPFAIFETQLKPPKIYLLWRSFVRSVRP